MIYIINNTTSYTTITKFEHEKTAFIEMSKPYKNTIGIKILKEEHAIKLILREKLLKLPFNEQVELNMKFHKNQLDKKEFALSNIKNTRNKHAIDFIERNF